MSNIEYGQRYLAAMQKLHGSASHTCQFPGCRTLALKEYCRKHRPNVAPVPIITHRRKA